AVIEAEARHTLVHRPEASGAAAEAETRLVHGPVGKNPGVAQRQILAILIHWLVEPVARHRLQIVGEIVIVSEAAEQALSLRQVVVEPNAELVRLRILVEWNRSCSNIGNAVRCPLQGVSKQAAARG